MRLAPGDIIRVRNWPATWGKQFVVYKVTDGGAVVHAFEVEEPETRGKLRSFPTSNVELVSKA